MNKKDNSVEVLRIIAIWAVVLIHTTSATLAVAGFYHSNIPFTFFLNQSARFAVPLFFLISGFVLQLRYPIVTNLLLFYKKRFSRLLIPFVSWSFIYYVLIAHAGIKAFFINLSPILLYGSGAEHLYFIPSLMFLYLLFPMITYTTQHFALKKYFLFYWAFLLLGSVAIFFDYYINNLSIPVSLRIAVLNLPVFIIGMLLAQQKENAEKHFTKFWVIFVSIIFLASFLLVNTEGNALSLHGFFLSYLMSQWRLSILLYTLSVFTLGTYLLKRINITMPSFLPRSTFFIFFIHVIFIHLFWRLWGAYLFSQSQGHIVEQVWFDSLVFLFVIICSYTTVFFVVKIPFVGKMLGIGS